MEAKHIFITGPAWCHPRVPDYCHLIGGLSADADPDRYVLSVDDLVSKYKQAENRSALVVSTMGWKQGELSYAACRVSVIVTTGIIWVFTDSQPPCLSDQPHCAILRSVGTLGEWELARLGQVNLHSGFHRRSCFLVLPHVSLVVFSPNVFRARICVRSSHSQLESIMTKI